MTDRTPPALRPVAAPEPEPGLSAGWEPDHPHHRRIVAAGHSAALELDDYRRRPSVCPACALRRPPPGWSPAPGYCADRPGA